jgi:hypothetical protein
LLRWSRWLRSDDIPEGRAWTWRIAGVHAGGEIAFPQVPLALDGFDFNVIGADTTASVTFLTTAKLPAGYGDVATQAADRHQRPADHP